MFGENLIRLSNPLKYHCLFFFSSRRGRATMAKPAVVSLPEQTSMTLVWPLQSSWLWAKPSDL